MHKDFNSKDILFVFGTNIRRARKMQGYDLTTLASSIDYDRGCLSSLEYGEQNIEYLTSVNLARKLNTSFPALFSRNYLNPSTDGSICFNSNFIEDDYLSIFIENFKKTVKLRKIKQIDIYATTNIQTSIISRIINRKSFNPTISTLYAMAYSIDVEMYSLFSRNYIQEENI